MNRFYIGQKIVAIKDHPQDIFKKGQEFTVLAIRKSCCCFEVFIGLEKVTLYELCESCGRTSERTSTLMWFNENRFEPIELSSMSFEDIFKLKMYEV